MSNYNNYVCLLIDDLYNTSRLVSVNDRIYRLTAHYFGENTMENRFISHRQTIEDGIVYYE